MDELLAEADELIRKFNEELLQDLEEGDRLQIDQHSQRLEEIKSVVRQNAGKEKTRKEALSPRGSTRPC